MIRELFERKNALKIGFISCIAVLLGSCGGDGEGLSGSVAVSTTPDEVKVFNAPTTITDPNDPTQTIDIAKPFFSAAFTFTNENTDKILVITAFEVRIFDASATGANKKELGSYYSSPKSYSSTAFDTETAFLVLGPKGVDQDGNSATADNQATINATFFFGGLPDIGEGNFRYRVEFEPIGFFATTPNLDVSNPTNMALAEANPTDNFKKILTFTTVD